jgi:hypothetical protein
MQHRHKNLLLQQTKLTLMSLVLIHLRTARSAHCVRKTPTVLHQLGILAE